MTLNHDSFLKLDASGELPSAVDPARSYRTRNFGAVPDPDDPSKEVSKYFLPGLKVTMVIT